MRQIKTAILHYSAPPVIGGVEAVIQAHAREFVRTGLPVNIIAGRGDSSAFPEGVEFIGIPEMDTQHPDILAASIKLNNGNVPENFEDLTARIKNLLLPELTPFDHLIVHNVFTKHFNLPLTAALFHLLDQGVIRHAIAWCHDLSWTSPGSRSKVFESYPWNLLKTRHSNVSYVAISLQRQKEISDSFGIPLENIPVIYNGVDPQILLGLSHEGYDLIDRLELWEADLILLMPVRVTRAKNIEYSLELVKEFKDRGVKVKLVLTGPPDPHDQASMNYYQKLRELRADLGVDNEMCFVFEAGPDQDRSYTIEQEVVSELLRVADVLFMPSLREGFGMPVLEAGLTGLPVVCSEVPAALEIAKDDVLLFSLTTRPAELASRMMNWLESKPEFRLGRRVRREYTWQSIFRRDLLPLLEAGE